MARRRDPYAIKIPIGMSDIIILVGPPKLFRRTVLKICEEVNR